MKTTGPVLATHSGKFHLDDVLGYVVLQHALRLLMRNADDVGAPGGHILLRTRDRSAIEGADIVWDVGGVHDPAARRFDHHQPGAPERPDGTRYSASGLVWLHFGRDALSNLLPDEDPGLVEEVWSAIDEGLVRAVDRSDNGIEMPPLSDLSNAVDDLNPAWDAPDTADHQMSRFMAASVLVDGILMARVRAAVSRARATHAVLEAWRGGDDPRLLVMDRGMPWKETVRRHVLPVALAVYPAGEDWMVDTIEAEAGGLRPRVALPEAWAGLRDGALAERTGVPDAVFCHLGRFVGAARSREGATALARMAMDIRQS